MTLTFMNSYENAINSRLAFDALSPKWRRQLFFRSAIISCFLLAVLIYTSYTTKFGTSIIINNTSYPIASLIVDIIWIMPVSVIAGWGDYKFSLATRKNAIISQFEGLPSDYFGMVSISIEQDGLVFQMPLFQGKHSWKVINSLKTTQEYLFFCLDNRLVLSVPLTALGNQQEEFISHANAFILSGKQPPSSSILQKDNM